MDGLFLSFKGKRRWKAATSKRSMRWMPSQAKACFSLSSLFLLCLLSSLRRPLERMRLKSEEDEGRRGAERSRGLVVCVNSRGKVRSRRKKKRPVIQRALASPPLPHFAFLFSSSSSKKKNHDASPAKRGQGPAPPVIPAGRALLRGPDLGAQARGLEGEGLGERKRRKKQKHGFFPLVDHRSRPAFHLFFFRFSRPFLLFLVHLASSQSGEARRPRSIKEKRGSQKECNARQNARENLRSMKPK